MTRHSSLVGKVSQLIEAEKKMVLELHKIS